MCKLISVSAHLLAIILCFVPASAQESSQKPAYQRCVDCHQKNNPQLVADWQASKHSKAGVGCDTCHPAEHPSDEDKAVLVRRSDALPTPALCAQCHDEQVKQFKSGKHAFAWASMKAMPTPHMLPATLSDGMKGCGGCHQIGLKTDAEVRELRKTSVGYGVASCDACHTRHTFSVEEAKQPEACETCHTGFDHPQWEIGSSGTACSRSLKPACAAGSGRSAGAAIKNASR